MVRFITVLFVACLFLVSGTALGQATYDTVSIDSLQYVPNPDVNDQSPFFGDTVVVRGLVMHGPRDLWVGARWAVHIVDPDTPTDPWSGFFIIQHDTFAIQTGLQFVQPGDIAYFTGVVDEFGEFSQVFLLTNPAVPVNIVSVGNPLPSAVVVTTQDLSSKTTGEQWESMWMEVQSATVVNNNISGNWASITDASGGTTYLAEYFNWFRDRLQAGTYDWPSNGTVLTVDGFVRDESGTPGQVFTVNPRDTFDVQIMGDPPPVVSDVIRNPGAPTSSDNVTVSATVVDNGAVQSAEVMYSVNEGSWQSLAMTANQDTFSASIPAQADGDFVRYFIYAEDNVGGGITDPGDTSRASGRVYFYTVRDAGLLIQDVQNTYGYALDNSGYQGYEVTLTGVVMTDSTDEVGDFWIQDAASAWSGVWVNNSPVAHVKGDEVSVTGVIEENFNVTRVDNVTQSSVVTPGVGEFAPVDVTTGEVTTGGVNAEAFESVLVRVQNVTVTDPFPDGFPGFGEFEVDDNSGGVRVDDLFDAFDGQGSDTTYALGDQIDYIIAFGYFSFGNAKLIPRDSLDVGPITDIENDELTIPSDFVLHQNYPNPFNPTTDIEYNIATSGNFTINIFNILGQKVKTLVNKHHSVGNYKVQWDGTDDNRQQVGSGIYFYSLKGNDVNLTKKMILLK